MVINIVLLILGAVFLVYGIKKKLTFWIVAGAVILCLGGVSLYMDFTMGGAGEAAGHRLPYVIDHFMR